MMSEFDAGFCWGWASIMAGLLLLRALDYYISKRRGNHISITGEQTEELTAWMVKWKREHPDMSIYLNGRWWG